MPWQGIFISILGSVKALYNDTVIEDHLVIGLNNRALQFGDGLFETIISNGTSIPLLKLHYDRLMNGAKLLSLNLNLSLKAFEEKIIQVIEANGVQDFNRIKVITWRESEDQQGYYSGSDKAELLITSHSCPKPGLKIIDKAAFAKNVKLVYHTYSSLKTTSALSYTMAAIERKNRQLDELIITDGMGHVSECVSSNLFWIKENQVYTPSLECGCVAGVMRQQLINCLKEEGIEINEIKAHKDELLSSDFIFTTNVAGVGIIKSLEGNSYPTSHSLFEEIIPLLEL